MGSGMILQFHATNGMKVTDDTLSKGLFYNADYSTNFTARSLIDKGYADATYLTDGTLIQDTTTTTGWFTEEEANILVGHSDNTGTNLILRLYEGTVTPVSVFQVDGEGNLFNNGNAVISINRILDNIHIATDTMPSGLLGQNNIFLGSGSGDSATTATNNIFMGDGTGSSVTSAGNNSCFGAGAGRIINGGDRNSIFGSGAGYTVQNSDNNSAFGYFALRLVQTGSGNVALGAYAGRYASTATSDKLFINNQDRGDAATELTDSLVYAGFDAIAANQFFRTNSKFCVNAVPLTNMVAGDALLEGGSLILKEITTPTADTNYGKVYTKSDNKMYFQDGEGVEHEIAFV